MPIFDAHVYFGGSTIPGADGSPGGLQTTLQSRGITGAVLMSAHARFVEPLAGNRILAKVIERSPGLYGCVVAHLNRAEASITAMRELMPHRRFVGMVLSGMHPDEPLQRMVADEIVNAYRRYGKPLFLYARNGAMAAAGLEIAKAFPMLKVVLLGMGGEDWHAGIAAAQAATNIYLETSGSLDLAKLPAALAAVASHRLIFGSGSPHVDPAAALGMVEDAGLSDDTRRRLLSENARRIFGLDDEDA